jgi:putative hydrolase of the HAD superfamily
MGIVIANSPQPFTGVIFDLDDTLNDRSASWNVFVHRLFSAYAGRIRTGDAGAVHQTILKSDRDGYRPKDELFGELRERLPWIDPPSAKELEAFWREHFAACMVERDGARLLLREMRSAGLRLGIVTNGHTRMQSAKVESLGLAPLVDAVVISETFGVKKPDPRIYEEALRRLSCRSDAVLFVGDNPLLDVVGPANLGMRTAWLKLDRDWPENLTAPNHTIASLSELRPVLRLSD